MCTEGHHIFASVQMRVPFTSEEVAEAVDATLRSLSAQLPHSAVLVTPLYVVPSRGTGWLVWGQASEPNEGAPIDSPCPKTCPEDLALLHNGERLLPVFFDWLRTKTADSVTTFGFV